MAGGNKKRSLASFKDVQLAYLMEGIAAVEAMVQRELVSATTLRRALRALQEAGKDCAALERFIAEQVGPIGRGRNAPRAGEVRSYKVQQVKAGGPFVRLPLDCLALEKGSVIRVYFESSKIVITK